MMNIAARLLRAKKIGQISPPSFVKPVPNGAEAAAPLLRYFSSDKTSFQANPVAAQMINYAVFLARSGKSDDSYSQAGLILEQCGSTQPDEDSKGLVLLAQSTLLFERGDIEAAISLLKRIQGLGLPSTAIKVAAAEALVGIHLEHYQEDAASVVADIASQLLDSIKLKTGDTPDSQSLEARAKAIKGLVELIHGNLDSAPSFFSGTQGEKCCIGNAALSYGEYLHGIRKLSTAKELYQKVIQGVSEIKDFCDPNHLGACNMTPEEVPIAATCALGQLEAHTGNFNDAEEILTAALNKMEECFGSSHPKVGVILTCIGLMFRHKAMKERSSSLLIQEGLYRRALELLKAPPLEVDGANAKVNRKDIIALARGGYAETLCVQQNRKAEGEKMKLWAEGAWQNRRISLAEALELSDSSGAVPVIDTRICRVV